MSQNTPENSQAENRQAGIPPGPSQAAEEGRVATGDRRDEVHFEPDPDQLVKASHLVRPAAIPDVRVAPDRASVWDARPTLEDEVKSGNPTGR